MENFNCVALSLAQKRWLKRKRECWNPECREKKQKNLQLRPDWGWNQECAFKKELGCGKHYPLNGFLLVCETCTRVDKVYYLFDAGFMFWKLPSPIWGERRWCAECDEYFTGTYHQDCQCPA